MNFSIADKREVAVSTGFDIVYLYIPAFDSGDPPGGLRWFCREDCSSSTLAVARVSRLG